jgi:ABC-type branched-subunit amino acid transport system substrate-binding protein
MYVPHRISARRRLAVGAVIAASTTTWVVPASAATTGGNGAPPGSSLVEAVVTAFTGPESFIGGVLSAGAYPAVYEIDQAGGVLGHNFVVKTVDTRGDPADALPLVERFLGSTSNVVGIVGTDGATANQLIPLFNSHKITVTSDVGSTNFDRTSYKYFWRFVAPDPVNGLAMALWAKKLGETRVALVFGTDTTAQTDLPGIQYGITHLHLNVVANISLTPDQPSYQAEAAKLLAANPQVIFTEEDATTAGTFFGDVAQLGTVPHIIGDSGTIENGWMSAVTEAIGKADFEKDYSALTSQPPTPTAANAQWKVDLDHSPQVNKPVSQWYNEPYAQAAHDGVIMQALAMLAAKDVQPSVYNSFIPTVTEPGAGKVKVYTFAQGKAALAAGKKIEYIGAVGPVAFNQWHNSYGNQVAVSFPTSQIANEKILGVVPASELESAG